MRSYFRRVAVVAGVVGAWGLAAAPAVAQTAEQTVDRAVKAYAKIHTVRATFTQRLTNPLTGSEVTSHGELQQRIPGYLSVRFTDPAGDRIVADGKAVWVYLPSTNPGQVIKAPLASGSAGAPDVASWFLDSPKTRYKISAGGTASIEGHATHAVVLVPRDSTIPFTKATVWVDDDDALLRQFETTDANGVVRRVTIERIVPNAKLDRGAFTFRVPKGVRVFEQS
ncbi:MAG TPA: outer membrane lipoprotein carrier protein LolA [Gemmatimonadaceae bacterium]